MFRSILIVAACAVALSACTADDLTRAKNALDNTYATEQAVCAAPVAPKFCSNPFDTAKINASYKAGSTAIQDALDFENSGSDDAARKNALIKAAIEAVANYVALTAAFQTHQVE